MIYRELYLKTKNKEYFTYLLLELYDAHFYEFEDLLNKKVTYKFQRKFERLEKGIPPQYILKYAYFYGNKFYVNNRVLIPRFSTESLVEKVLEYLNDNDYLLELGVGSGASVISLALKKSEVNYFGSDISEKALKVAKRNSKLFKTSITFFQSDWFENIPNLKFNIIFANPPYVLKEEPLDNYVLKEPHLALFTDNLFSNYHKIIKESKNWLTKYGKLILEINPLGKEKIMEYGKKYFLNFELFKDLDGKERIVIFYD